MSHNQLDSKSQAWSALFSEPMSDLVKRYTSSVFFDKRMWQADIQGSLAHAEMLAAQKIISKDDHASIEKGLAQVAAEIESGAFEWKLDLEDVHLNIEARLTQLVGDAGKRTSSAFSSDNKDGWSRTVAECRIIDAKTGEVAARVTIEHRTGSVVQWSVPFENDVDEIGERLGSWLDSK